tara:strand:+ start:246 stop:470 length:225 start_codon:yes stop_codon:yes gene_type:complete
MSNTKKTPMLLKILFILLFLVSLSFNLALINNLEEKDVSISGDYKYERAYNKLIKVLGVSPEESLGFLEKANED